MLTGLVMLLWHRWLERETTPVRLVVMVVYLALMVVLVRLFRAQLLGVPD
jgi:hypothetical protein